MSSANFGSGDSQARPSPQKQHNANAQEPPGPTWPEPMDILAISKKDLKPADFVLPGLVAGSVGAIVSPGGVGKSALALQLCAQISEGPDFTGISAQSGKAAYLPGEDPEDMIEHRIRALTDKSTPEQLEAMRANLAIVPLERFDVNILNAEHEKRLKGLATGRRLLIIDTLRISHGEDENDSGAMSSVIGVMKRIAADTGCAIVFLHHVNKGSSNTKKGAEQQASRGSSVLVDNIRWQAYLMAPTEEEMEQHFITEQDAKMLAKFGVSKQNYGKPFTPVWFRKVSCLDPKVDGGFTLEKTVIPSFESTDTSSKSRGKIANNKKNSRRRVDD